MDFSEAKEHIVERLITELPKKLYYHGAHHTFDVVKSIYSIAKSEKLSNLDFFILLTAAYYHDAGFIYKYDDNEPVAVKMARADLPQFEYSEEQIETISGIILATKSSVQPKNILEEIMCDADHDYFGRHDYKKIAISLRKELLYFERSYTDEEWLELQLNYLQNKHRYYTKTAIETRKPEKDKQIELLKASLAKIKNVK